MRPKIPGRVAFQVRINEKLRDKVRAIANAENRNLNSQIEYLLRKGVENYEAEHGEIQTEGGE